MVLIDQREIHETPCQSWVCLNGRHDFHKRHRSSALRVSAFCLILILLCMCVFLVLGFFVQTGNSFHMYRNAPGHSNWKWIWFCIIVPLIVKTVISASGFQRIFRICDWLHWLCLVLLVISHPLESEFKWISGYYNEASSFSIFLMLFSVCGNPMYYELILLSSKYSSFIPFY